MGSVVTASGVGDAAGVDGWAAAGFAQSENNVLGAEAVGAMTPRQLRGRGQFKKSPFRFYLVNGLDSERVLERVLSGLLRLFLWCLLLFCKGNNSRVLEFNLTFHNTYVNSFTLVLILSLPEAKFIEFVSKF